VIAAVRKYGAWVRLEGTAVAAYRVQLFLSLFGWVVPLAFMALWNTAASNSGVMTSGQSTAYYIVLLVATNFGISGDIIFSFGPMVYSGELSTLLMMPYSSVLVILARPVVTAVIRSLPLVVIIPLMAIAMNASFTRDPLVIAAAVGLGLLGWISTVAFSWLYALAALWVGKWNGIMGLLSGVQWVLGGLVAPSAFMPTWLAWCMRLSPFWLAEGGMGELLAGVMALQWWMPVSAVGWIVVLGLLFRLAWPRAMRRFEAVGI
jgi:ABC-type uncharacterized transport system permease subunit